MNEIKNTNWMIFVIISLFMACTSIEDVDVIETKEPNPDIKSTYTYLALGDSYTIGESVEEVERWPMILADEVRKEVEVFSKPMIVARTGWTTDELSDGIKEADLEEKYDFVSLLIGVNNQFRGRNVENFRSEFGELLDRAIDFAFERDNVFVVSIPDWGVMPFAEGRDQAKIAKEIDLYNRIVEEECAKKLITYIDITPISREATQDEALVARDGLHPSGKMYKRWVIEEIFPAIKEKL